MAALHERGRSAEASRVRRLPATARRRAGALPLARAAGAARRDRVRSAAPCRRIRASRRLERAARAERPRGSRRPGCDDRRTCGLGASRHAHRAGRSRQDAAWRAKRRVGSSRAERRCGFPAARTRDPSTVEIVVAEALSVEERAGLSLRRRITDTLATDEGLPCSTTASTCSMRRQASSTRSCAGVRASPCS